LARYNQTLENRCVPFDEWPVQDQAAWLAAMLPAEFLEQGGIAAGWSDGGRHMVVDGYGHWLTWAARTGRLNSTAEPTALVTVEAVRAYVASMEMRLAPMTVQGRVRQLGRAMRALAPDGNWKWLFRAADGLRSVAVNVRDKRGRMQDVSTLVALGFDLMRRATATDVHFAVSRAVLYRDGLMIALIAHRPLRRRTFAAIDLGLNLVQHRGRWWLNLEPSDIKTYQEQTIRFPEELVEALNIYLAEHRPVLLHNKSKAHQPPLPTSALWIAKGGRSLGESAISLQIGSIPKRPSASLLTYIYSGTAPRLPLPSTIQPISALPRSFSVIADSKPPKSTTIKPRAWRLPVAINSISTK
jgi:integrase/recombinase XerD